MTNITPEEEDPQMAPASEAPPEPERFRYQEFLPPGCYKTGVGYARKVVDSRGREHVYPVSLNHQEALDKRLDYYHEEFGWLRFGFKPERDRSVESRMMDRSVSVRPKMAQ